MKHKPRAITKDAALSVACPLCGAGAGRYCRNRDGNERQGCHLERFLEIDKWSRMTQMSLLDMSQQGGLGI